METYSKNVVRVVAIACLTLALIGLAAFTVWHPGWLKNVLPGSQPAAAAAADLLTTGNFAVLAGSGITNTGTTVITGDVGTYPTATETGFSTVTITGTDHAGDATTQQAKTDLVTAYNALAGQSADHTISADLGGQTLTPGVYKSASTIGLTGTLTLDGGDDPNAVFVFQAGSALTTLSGSSVVLTHGTQACNVFWQVGSDATLGTNSTFRGTLIALSSITVTTGVTVDGRVLARNGAVTLDTNTIAKTTCAPSTTGTLHIIKSVINVTGTAVASDFTLHVKSAGVDVDVSGNPGAALPGVASPGRLYTLPAGTYTVSEDTPSPSLYTQAFGLDCVGGSVTLLAGQSKTCTIVNTDIPPPAPTVGSGPTVPPPAPLIALTKIPNPLALPGGAGSVTYTYTATNIGTAAMHDVSVKDDKCSPVTLASGDTNGNSVLEVNETWVYHCTKTVSATETNTATARGSANGFDAYAVALATVAVGVSTPPPLIDIVKVPSRLTPLPFGGGSVTYTYTVTNPGVVVMHDVVVTDDKCTPVSRVSGDVNGNNLLEPGESWVYTCKTNVPVSTRNIAAAAGSANGFIALGYAFATVLVAAPSLPNTGLSPASQTLIDDKVLASIPTAGFRLTIPKINVDTELESVGLTPEGAVGVPEGPLNAAWFNQSSRPGEKGTAVIDGHYGWKDGMPAVFDDLHTLQKGDKLYVEDAKGATTAFVVHEVRTYGKSDDASGAFASKDGGAHLILITCAGVWDAAARSYSDRVVVFADKE